MFASQLLRILQTIPSDVKCDTCVCDSAEQDMTMKENQNDTPHDSKSFGREADCLALGSKEICQLNGLRTDTHPSPFEVKGRGECWNRKFMDEISMDNQNGTGDSTDEDTDSLSSYVNAKDRAQSSPEHECSVAGEEFMHRNENESRDSRSPYIAASDLFGRDNHLYTDKNVLDCEPPELIVCYKEINYHVVKDICIDEGMPVNNNILIDSTKDDQSGHSVSRLVNDNSYCDATGAVDIGLLISDGLATITGVGDNEQGSKEESHGILLSQGRLKSQSESSFDAEDCDPEESMQKGKTNFGATNKIVTHASELESFVDRTLPIQEFGTRSFLRSFLNSLDGDGNTVGKLPDQISSGEVVCGGSRLQQHEIGPKEAVQTSSLQYHSKVENGSITFNFNSLPGGAGNQRTENVKPQSVESSDVLDHKDADPENHLHATQDHCNGSKDSSSENIHQQSLIIEGTSTGNPFDKSPHHNDENSVDLSSNGLNKSVNSVNNDGQVVDSHVMKHQHNDSVVSLGKYDEGETSFANLITFSGPIAHSGSVSLRSDSSATSGRSFAFPVLQPEWNSSPVRMTKAEERRFRKHKGWRSGLLCCKF